MSNSGAPTMSSTTPSPPSSMSSDDSEATTLSVSSSCPVSAPDTSTPPTRADQTASSGSAIRYEDRIFVVGATGTGKSHLARELFLSVPASLRAPRLVIDPADSSITASAVGETPEEIALATFRDPANVPKAPSIRFVPRDPADRDAYDAVYRHAFENFPRFVWLDEAGIAAPAQGFPRWLNTYVVQGRKRVLGHLAAHTRPREVCRNLIAQSQHVVIFDMPNPDDRAHVADIVGLPKTHLEKALAKLPKYGFLWWNVVTRKLTVCPPLDVTP